MFVSRNCKTLVNSLKKNLSEKIGQIIQVVENMINDDKKLKNEFAVHIFLSYVLYLHKYANRSYKEIF
jgi:hypothetical protein